LSYSGQLSEAETPSSHGLFYWPPFWFFIFLVLVVGAISYVTFQQNKADTRQKEMKLLSTIADLKVEEITKWREERKGDAETLAQGPFFSREAEKWLQRGMPPGESRSMILERMESMHRAYGYRDIFLFDADGKPVLATSPDAPPPGGPALEAVNEAIRTQSIIFMDIGSRDEARSMGLAAPVLVIHDGKPKTTGAIYLQIDPSRFLFPLLKAIPLTSKSTEIVLVRREGNEVLFLNVSAANEGAGLLRQPLSQSGLPAAIAVSGNQMEADGTDYRGTPVFAALRKIPGTDWSLVAKVEQQEIYAPLQKMAWLVAGAITVLIALTGVAVGLWWRNQRARFLIAEQQQTEKNLRAASAYARNLIEASLDPLVTISAEGKVTDVNKATEEATGFSRSELIGTDFASYFTEPEMAQAGYRQVFNQGFVHDYPLTIRHQSGRLIDVLYNATVYRDEAGNIQGVFAAARDITERKQAEESVRISQARFSTIFNQAPLGIALIDSFTGQIYEVNPRFAEIAGRTIEEMMTVDWMSITHPDDVQKDLDNMALLNTGKIPGFNMDKRYLLPDGSFAWINMTIAPLRLEKNISPRHLCMIDDITERKQAEEEIRRLNSELEQRVVARTFQLEAVNKELEGFAYSVSHDLRVPLRAIDGFSRLVLKQSEDKLDDEGKRLLNVVRDNTKKMGQLIDDILAFSRAGRLEIKALETDMEALARDVWQEIEPSMTGRDVRLDIKPLPKVQGDPAMLRQVWINLLGNAAKFTNSRATARIEVGGSLGLAANGAGNECTFYVKDNGVGFDQQYVEKLFGVFQRLHGVDEFEGTGIGLAIVKRIITRHGGRVWAEGKVNEGATIYFALPR